MLSKGNSGGQTDRQFNGQWLKGVNELNNLPSSSTCHFLEASMSRSREGFIRHSTCSCHSSIIGETNCDCRLRPSFLHQQHNNLRWTLELFVIPRWFWFEIHFDTFQFNRIATKWPVLVVMELSARESDNSTTWGGGRSWNYYLGIKSSLLVRERAKGCFMASSSSSTRAARETTRSGCCTAQFLIKWETCCCCCCCCWRIGIKGV